MGYIYRITNLVDGKMYIGKTEHNDPYQRWREHVKQCTLRLLNEKRPLYYAINKYGIDNFNFEIIEEAENGNILCEREKYYINKYRTYVGFDDCNGYNLTLGGDGRSYLSLNEQDVVEYYNTNYQSVNATANHFHVSHNTIEKILFENNIQRPPAKSSEEYYVYKYGGIVMMDYNGYSIIDILDNPQKYEEKYGFNVNGIKKALYRESGYKSGHAQHYMWYRLNELPNEYKPLLKKFYKENKDNSHIIQD